MNNRSLIPLFIKAICLIIVDIITLMLFLTVWVLFNYLIFPFAFSNIVITLIILNIVILASGILSKRLSLPTSASIIMITIIFYLTITIFTALTYLTITPKWYFIDTSVVYLIYFAIIGGLYFSGLNAKTRNERQNIEKASVFNAFAIVLSIGDSISKLSGNIPDGWYNTINSSYISMTERLNASTPFGRSSKQSSINIENQITSKLAAVHTNIVELPQALNISSASSEIIKCFEDISNLIKNKEKLMLS
jgi:hypothetical protein